MPDSHRRTTRQPPRADPLSPEAQAAFEGLLEYLKHNRGFDFTGYKRSTLIRRVSSRMAANEIETFAGYLDFLQVHPQEFTELFDALLINVTGFFRDPPAWDYMADHVLPRILERKPDPEPIRVWSAGCASGEEAYTLAMVLAEKVGVEEMQRRVKIYATDVDEAALNVARHGYYSPRDVASVPEPLVERYFERQGTVHTFRKDLRRTLIFGRHDLVQAAPISHIDLLVCRNTIMYFNRETQGKVLARLHFALEDGGFLFLGKAEMLLGYADLFSAVDLKRPFLTKLAKEALKDRLEILTEAGGYDADRYPVNFRRTRELAVDGVAAAVVAVHANGTLALVNRAARSLFGVSTADVGRPFPDVALSYRPAELRSTLEKVLAENRPVLLPHVEWKDGPGDTDCFDIHVVPITTAGETPVGAVITFIDVSLPHRLQSELDYSNRDLETAYEELQSTNEELETTNEELQSTIEELETTNEELHSTNEELETMNAELHTTNEELQTINDELRLRSTELDELNAFLESILTSQRGGMAVVDRELRVMAWNHHSQEMWGLRPDEVPGQHFLNLDIGLPVEELRPAMREILAGGSERHEVVLAATNRRGRDFRCRVRLGPLVGREENVRGVILHMENTDG